MLYPGGCVIYRRYMLYTGGCDTCYIAGGCDTCYIQEVVMIHEVVKYRRL